MDSNTKTNTDELKVLRDKIDVIDKQLLPLFLERMDVCGKVADYKIRSGMNVFDPVREKQVLDNKLKMVDGSSFRSEVYEFFNSIMTISRIRQTGIISRKNKSVGLCNSVIAESRQNITNPVVAYFGDEGSYTEEAAIDFFGEDCKRFCKGDFESVLKTVAPSNPTADYAVVPIENSSTGTIADVTELIPKFGLYVVGEVSVPIRHCLVGINGAAESDIKTVYSHHQALMQCSQYLSGLSAAAQDFESTAVAAKMIAEKNDKSCAAIASERTAMLYNLCVIKSDIVNSSCNTTRFAVVAARPEINEQCSKISLAFTLKHESGELYRILGAFARCGLNLMKLESRPIADRPFEYRFYADFTGNLLDDDVKAVVEEVRGETQSFKILGCYRDCKTQ